MWQDEDLIEGALTDADQISVLVVVVPSQDDWRRICQEHWYRIPLKRAPQRIGARYLAFYHTSGGGDLRWGIHYYAPVEGYRLATRRELIPAEADHPRANDRYYRIALGALQRLPQPIPSHKLRRVTFIATTLQHLWAAQEINDLWLKDSAQGRYGRAYHASEHQLGEGLAPYLWQVHARSIATIQP